MDKQKTPWKAPVLRRKAITPEVLDACGISPDAAKKAEHPNQG